MSENQDRLTLAARIVLAMEAVGSVAKAGKNKDQGYAYQKAADIFAAAQEAFAEHGVCLIADEGAIEWPDPLTTKSGATMFVCRATMVYTFEDVLSSEQKQVKSTGVGFDTSDKALNKAKTMALKYMLKQTLMIGEDEDDADRDTPEEAAQPACPNCGVVGAIIKGRPEYGGGWICFQKKGGCGAKFATDPALEQRKEEPRKRSQGRPKTQATSTPAQTAEKPPGRTPEPAASTPEGQDQETLVLDGDEGPVEDTLLGTPEVVQEDIRQMAELIESTKWPAKGYKSGMEAIFALYHIKKLADLNDEQRAGLRKTLETRQRMIDEKKIQV